MELSDPNDVLSLFKNLMMKIVEETKKPTINFDLNERYYKRNMGQIAQIDVSTLYLSLSSIFEQINELKTTIALDSGFHTCQSDYQTLLRQFCDDYQDVVNVAASIKSCLDQRSGLLGFFKGYDNPIETILSGKSYQLNYQQLHSKFSYHAVVLQQSEKKMLDVVAKDLDDFMVKLYLVA
ncbi:conserved hypothetical protein [Vibrio crassostreae]|nr:conserved hypothetical protein [Vibrio crassostreae]CAK2664048.1 conserved hypothetical protein [Vibrio crassostreae]CAK2665809.1 conserved hypothetical protein [Vibrio crassostreae]CAK2676271.1 conserved hypothetical protein [Vibrio crassostreae]CAK3081901.1 conserved hypothetical protein [Vibrio crassostreae]